MQGTRRVLLVAATALCIALLTDACARRAVERSALPLARIVDAYQRETAPYFPFIASEAGNRQYDRVLANDIGEEYRRGLEALCSRYRQELRTVDRAPLTDGERLTYEIFEHRLDTCLADFKHPWHLLPINQAGSWPNRFPVLGMGKGQHPFKTVRNYEDFLGRIDGFVVWVDTAIANMRTGMARGITQPREAMVKVLPQLEAQIVEDPRASGFYEPVKEFPSTFDAATRQALTARYLEAIQQKIVPTYRRLLGFVRDEYLPACRASYGFRDLPGGPDMYRQAVRGSTTTSLTPDEIFELGLAEVKRITTTIDALRAEIEARGDPPAARYRGLDELLGAYGELRGAVEAGLPRLFGRFPRAGFEIRAIEPFRERSTPSSYAAASPDGSRQGVFYLNAAAVRAGGDAGVSRSLFLHEAVPGHHFQISLQRENRALPGFRRFGGHGAFVEGWALYAETLGSELGVYPQARDRLDALFSERFRAARLVVDVGLHEKGWTRDQVIAYLGGRRQNAELEAERYMVWPAQALGYQIGHLKIRALRTRAETTLGAAFDIRAFHDELLKDGSMPLGILEAKMDRWIAARRRAP